MHPESTAPRPHPRTSRQQQVARLGEEANRVDALVVALPGVDPALGQVGGVSLVTLVTRRCDPRATLRPTVNGQTSHVTDSQGDTHGQVGGISPSRLSRGGAIHERPCGQRCT
jgi:hypothetical protein